MSLVINISKKPYPIIKQASEVSSSKATINYAKYVGTNRSIRTEDANTCVIVGLNNSNGNCLMHLAPEQQSIRTLAAGLNKCVETLIDKYKNGEEKITGFIVGGRDSLASKDSNPLYTAVANILDDLGIPFTMICGKKSSLANDNVNLVGKNATIWNNSFGDELILNKNSTQKEIQEALEELYEAVEISPEVPIKFVEQFEASPQHLANIGK